MSEVIQRLFKLKSGAFIDVGVNLGQTLLKVAAIDPGRAYVGFEPNPACVDYVWKLIETNNLETYMTRLVTAFNPGAVAGVMCRNTLSIGWDGQLYDCDFNQMLDLGLAGDAPRHIRDFDVAALERREIVTGRHCFGCTAGAGSSCGGTVA